MHLLCFTDIQLFLFCWLVNIFLGQFNLIWLNLQEGSVLQSLREYLMTFSPPNYKCWGKYHKCHNVLWTRKDWKQAIQGVKKVNMFCLRYERLFQNGSFQHELLICKKNDSIGHQLFNCLQKYMSQVDVALKLDYWDMDVEKSNSLTLLTEITLEVWSKGKES